MHESESNIQEQIQIPTNVRTKILAIVSEGDVKILSNFINFFNKKRLELSLMSENSFKDIWSRHILDSIQLNHCIKEVLANTNHDTRSAVIDLGSGNGFPIIPIILTIKEKNVDYFLIEKSKKKANYLVDVCKKMLSGNVSQYKLNIDIICEDFTAINNINKQFVLTNRPHIIITARAFKSIDTILDILSSHQILEHNITLILLKGANSEIELVEAKKLYTFDVKIQPSATEEGCILIFKNIRKVKQ